MTLNDPEVVRREYATERGLEGPRAAYQYADGPDAREVAFAALAELYDLVGLRRHSYPFSAEDGEARLLRHFARVERRDAPGWITFPDRDAAQSFVDASATLFMRGRLSPRDGAVRVRRAPTIFVAEKT